MRTPDEQEFRSDLPTVFSGLELAYVETRRIPGSDTPLTGNTSSGPALLARNFRSLAEEHLGAEAQVTWIADRQEEAEARIAYLREQTRSGLCLPHPVHGIHLAQVDKDPVTFQGYGGRNPRDPRRIGDAAITTLQGRLTGFAPADCPVLNVAYYQHHTIQATAQIHAGMRGLARNIIGRTLFGLERQRRLPASTAIVYISPHAAQLEVYGPIRQAFEAVHLAPYLGEQRLGVFAADEAPLAMARLALDQLLDAGVPADQIEMSSDDTRTDPTLFSHREHMADPTHIAAGRQLFAFGQKR